MAPPVISLTHISLASFFWDIGKQYSSRCDAAERGDMIMMGESIRQIWVNRLHQILIISPLCLDSGVGLSPTRGTYVTSQVLLVGVPGDFPCDSPIFNPPTDWTGSCELK